MIGATERREALESAMWQVSGAMEDLKGYPEFEDFVIAMKDMYADMLPMLEKLDADVAAEYAEQRLEQWKDFRRGLF